MAGDRIQKSRQNKLQEEKKIHIYIYIYFLFFIFRTLFIPKEILLCILSHPGLSFRLGAG